MSIFIGNDNNSTPVVHITSSGYSENAMKSGVNSSTLFHSSLPYLQQKLYTSVQWYEHVAGGQYPYMSRSVLLSTSIINLILAGYEFMIIVNSVNSGNLSVGLPVSSFFTRTTPPFVSVETSSRTGYYYGPNSNPSTWTTSYSTPSTTNCYLALENPLSLDNQILLKDTSIYGTVDSINSVKIVVFDMKSSGVINKIEDTEYIRIDNTQFKVSSLANGVIDLASMSSLKFSPTVTSSSFKSMGSNINIQPYLTTATLPVSWYINLENSNDPNITKIGANLVNERVVGSNVNSLINYNSTTTSYSLNCYKNSWVYYNTGVTVPAGHAVSIINNGTFSNTAYPNATTYGKTFFLSNGGSVLISNGYTYRNVNGTEIFGDYYLYTYIESNVLKVKTYARNFTSQQMDVGTFSGSLLVHFFKY